MRDRAGARRKLAQVEARAAAHGESVAALESEVARVEAILASLAAALRGNFRARTIPPRRASPRCGAQPPNSATN